ncbi:MAG TPA: hypothetical protein VIR33_19030 [Thermopolyspora sp.]|jgi:hypothetical protein
MDELALAESPSLRAQYVDRVDVLDKVKALSLLPDGAHADIPIVAEYYEVGVGTIEKVIQRNRAELEGNGLRVLKGEAYRRFAADNLSVANPNARSITLFSRRAILNVGQMLTESAVAGGNLLHGSMREVVAWTQKDLPLFEEVWDVYYAADHARDEQEDLFGALTGGEV